MKLSPRSIPYRTAQRASSLVVIAVFLITTGAGRLVGGPLVVGSVLAVGLLALVAYELAYFDRFEYELAVETLDITSGVFGRREREIPYHRIQNVDISRNVVQRLLGIAAVGFETAGGRQTEGSIRYVSVAEAKRLQEAVTRRKRSEDRVDAAPAATPDELYAITPSELGLIGALSFDARVIGVVFLVVPGSLSVMPSVVADPTAVALTLGGLVAGAALVVAAWVLGVVVAVVNYYGFRLTRDGDELRYERGLIRRYSGSIPMEKVQTITIEDNPLKRAAGYATLRVETAGYSPGQGSERGSQAAVPLAPRERIVSLAESIEPVGEPRFRRPPPRIRRRYALRYLLGIVGLALLATAAGAFLPVDLPGYAVVGLALLVPGAAHYKWVHRGYWVGPDHVLTRNGFWTRSTKITPHYRVQTIVETRTVFQRRWRVATVVVDTAGSPSILGSPTAAVDVGVPDAERLRSTLTDRLYDAIDARRRIGPARRSTGASR